MNDNVRQRNLVLNNYTRKIAKQWVDDAPDGYVFTPPKQKTRSLSSNAKMWAMLSDIARQVQWPVNGKTEHLTPDEWKDIITASLAEENRMAAGIRGGFVMLGKRTSKMTIKQMNDVIEFMYAFGTENNVIWSEEFDIPGWAA